VAAALAVAREHGVRCDRPLILSSHHNVVVHLAPAPVVARVAGRTRLVRPQSERLAAGVRLGSFLAANGAPVVPPNAELDPGSHRHGGTVVTFWTYVDERATAPPAETAAALRKIHRVAARFDAALPDYDPRAEALDIAALLDARDDELAPLVRSAAERLVLPNSRRQPLHGDAHLGNAVETPDGVLWNDLEEVCTGPVEWVLACLEHRRLVFGELDDEIEQALAAYGDHDADLRTRLAQAVCLFTGAWSALASGADPSLRPRAERRLDYLRYALEM